MNKYFIEILKDRTLLIIPKFGALTVANRQTGKIVFNKNLTYDDNVLSDYIAEKEGVDKVEAKNIIAKFVREIEAMLDKGDTYDIYQFGKFFKNDKGEIIFESELKSIEKENTNVVPKTDVSKATKKEVEQKLDDKKENVYIPPIKETSDKVKEEPKKSSPNSVEDIKNKYKKSATSSASKKDVSVKSKEKSKSKTKNVKQKEEDKKKRSKLPLILLLLLLIGCGIAGYFYQDKIKDLLGINKTEQHDEVEGEHSDEDNLDNENHNNVDEMSEFDENEAIVDSLSEEITIEEDVIPEEENEEITEGNTEKQEDEENEPAPIVQSSVNGNYHIIGGAFGEEANATRFAQKTGGTVLGKFNGLFQVAIKSYDTREDAKSGLKQLSSEYPSAWILKYSK